MPLCPDNRSLYRLMADNTDISYGPAPYSASHTASIAASFRHYHSIIFSIFSISKQAVMSLHRETHFPSSLSDTNSSTSDPSRSSSPERSSHSIIQPRRIHHHHSDSAPQKISSRTLSNGFTTDTFSPSSSTLVSSEDGKAASNPSLTAKLPTNHPTKTKKKAKNSPSANQTHKLKEEKGCLALDWGYHNIYSSGSSHGRKAIGGGSGSVGACVLM